MTKNAKTHIVAATAAAVAGIGGWFQYRLTVAAKTPDADVILYTAPVFAFFAWALTIAAIRIFGHFIRNVGPGAPAQTRRVYLGRLAAFGVLAPLTFMVGAALFVLPARRFTATAASTSGVVVQGRTQNHGAALIEYRVASRTYTLYGHLEAFDGKDPRRSGSVVRVFYDPSDPASASLNPKVAEIHSFWGTVAVALLVPTILVGMHVLRAGSTT